MGLALALMRGLLSISCFKVHFSLPFRRGLAYSTTLLLLYVFSQLVLERKIKLHTTRISGEKLKKTLFYSLIILTELLFVATFTCCDKDDNTNTNNGGVNIAIDADPNKYIDLGLPSGTKWKNSNESGFYDFELATKTFGNNLPTKEQLEELVSYCTYTWDKNKKGGYFVSSINGNSIFLPAEGERDGTDLRLDGNGFVGNYWSSTINNSNSDYVWYLGLHSSVFIYSNKSKKNWCSVRLVHN